MEKRWSIKEEPHFDVEAELSAFEDIGPIIGRLLALRGITSREEAHAFFYPTLAQLHDPFLMKDMAVAVDRLIKAISSNESILIYGDYDVDGTTSVALVYSFLKEFHPHIDYYIPDRCDEGYGISQKSIDLAEEKNISLVIALDCGIKAVDKIAYAREKGIDFIICDHHTPGAELPEAVACLDPKREDCNYPDKNLSGCGVGFKFMQAFAMRKGVAFDRLLRYIDLVVVSIASDVVPVTGENRTLAVAGLKKLNQDPCLGLKSIIQVAGIDGKELELNDIVFKIGPRLNAAGRIESGNNAVKLLICNDEKEAYHIGCSINRCNETRKDLDRNITREAIRLVATDKNLSHRKTTVLYQPCWHQGVIGIVASRLSSLFCRPSVILTRTNELIVGSARSVDGYNVYQAIEACQDLLENFGGHDYAAGLTLKPENVEVFAQRFEEVVAHTIEPAQLVPQIDVDVEIRLKDITQVFFDNLKRCHPFGPGNPKPVFVTRNVYDFGTSKVVGRHREHLMLELIESDSPKIIRGIAFGKGHLLNRIKSSQPFDICYTIEECMNNHPLSLQLMVLDIKWKSEQ